LAADVIWHTLEDAEVCTLCRTDPEGGLGAAEAKRRQQEYGANELTEKKAVSPLVLFLGQFKDFMVLVLAGAAVLSGFLGEIADTVAILTIIVLNAVLGFIQEYRAEKSIAALKKMAAPTAKVIRDGAPGEVAARDLVPGDILLLEAGDRIPADARLLEANSLNVDESMLTGESTAVRKHALPLPGGDLSIGDRKNMIYMGTNVTDGRGRAAVVATGMKTEMGRIAGLIQAVKEEMTPLQKRLEQLGKLLVAGCILVCLVVVATGLLRGEPLMTMIMSGISLAVAAIPEGLPAIVTVALAVGVQRMIKRKALVRKLPAVETLGCTNVICSDKTGTLTENKMTVRKIYAGEVLYYVSGVGYVPEGTFTVGEDTVAPHEAEILMKTLEYGALCNNAALKADTISSGEGKARQHWQILGDPTEGAIIVAAGKAGIRQDELKQRYPRRLEVPFDSTRKRMAVACADTDGTQIVCVKGAADIVLELCREIRTEAGVRLLTEADRQNILAANENMAREALRVLAVAGKRVSELAPDTPPEAVESDLVFYGLVGMIDPPRLEVKKAVAKCQEAGIGVVMITGDHPTTAAAIAREVGLLREGGTVLTGRELEQMPDGELQERVTRTSVFARVSPHHKLRIVKALEANGQVVAMTGDGVNDAPAVKEAGIGIAMGITGTDVTKEASSMVLLDDNFATIVAAVEEGRAIYANIRKFIRYLLSCNTGEVLTMFLAALLRLPLPLLPIQILWVNLVTDGLPAIALGVDPASHDIMMQPPRGSGESVFARGLSRKIIVRGVLISVATLGAFVWTLTATGENLATARTVAFATLITAQLFHVFDCRSESQFIWQVGLFSNPYLVAAVVVSDVLLFAAVYVPFLQSVFNTVPLAIADWLLVILAAASVSGLSWVADTINGYLQRQQSTRGRA
jgi:Ca2+-transporting ATPase